jgi:hypothetical protein
MDAPGVDNISGRGVLNLAKAFAPQGTMTLAGSEVPVSLESNAVLSPAMGDATGNLKGVVFLDGYARAYETDLSPTLSRGVQDTPLHAALGGRYSTRSAGLGPLAVSVTTGRNPDGTTEARLLPMGLSAGQAHAARAISATAVGRLSPKTVVAFGLSESGRALQQSLSPQQGEAFLVARGPSDGSGFQGRAAAGIGIRHDFGPLALTITTESGEVRDRYPAREFWHSKYRASSLIADRQLGRVHLSFSGSLLLEEETILGGRFSSAFASGGSTTGFANGAASLHIGRGWGMRASYQHGWTSIPSSGALIVSGRLLSNAFAFDLAKTGTIRAGDRMAFRVLQPLRVRSGGFNINLPVSYDYGSGEVGYEHRFLNLAPTGRELDYELTYGARLWGGHIAANAFVRTDPGHIEQMKNDLGAALRFTRGF